MLSTYVMEYNKLWTIKKGYLCKGKEVFGAEVVWLALKQTKFENNMSDQVYSQNHLWIRVSYSCFKIVQSEHFICWIQCSGWLFLGTSTQKCFDWTILKFVPINEFNYNIKWKTKNTILNRLISWKHFV